MTTTDDEMVLVSKKKLQDWIKGLSYCEHMGDVGRDARDMALDLLGAESEYDYDMERYVFDWEEKEDE